MELAQEIFDPEINTFELTGLETLANLCKYKDHDKGKFIYGFLLAEDLLTDQGVTLYTKNTPVTPAEIKRLYQLQDTNPTLTLKFKLTRSARLLKSFRKEITGKLELLVELRLNYKVYKSLLSSIAEDVKSFVDEILKEEDVVLAIYKMKYLADNMPGKEGVRFFNHSVSTALFTFAIARSDSIAKRISFSDEELRELTKSALFHNFGALLKIAEILKIDDPKEREKAYHSANRITLELIKTIELPVECKLALKMVIGYYHGEMSFCQKHDRKSVWMANIILVADQYLRLETGLFGIKFKPSQIIDKLIILSVENKLNQVVVKTLAVDLNMTMIINFYLYIEGLKKLCNHRGGNHAVPYPFTGFRTPSTFICRENLADCPHNKGVSQAVNIAQDLPNIKKGNYARCNLVTGKLIEFYKKNFKNSGSN